MKKRTSQTRKPIADKPTLHTKAKVTAPQSEDKDKVHKSVSHSKKLNKTPAGNFSILRELLMNGGKGEDALWIFGLRSPKPFSSYKK